MALHTGNTYSIQRIDPCDRATLIVAHESAWSGETPPPLDVQARQEWLYLGCPAGRAEVFVLRTSDGQLVGMLAMVPRHFWIRGTRRTLGVLCDFIVQREHRTLLPALKLQRAAREIATANGWGTMAIPNSKALPVIRRLGEHLELQRPRLARVLRHQGYLRRQYGSHAALASRALDGAFSVYEAMIRRSQQGLVSRWVSSFDSQFDELWQRILPEICMGDRSAMFLKWRFGEEPGARNETVGVFDDRTGRLIAYAVGTISGRALEVRDFVCSYTGHRLTACLGLMMGRFRELDVDSVSCRLYADARTLRAFARLGFVPRESDRVLIYGADDVAANVDRVTRADEDV